MDSQFVINGKFRVDEAVNTVTDLETGTVTRLEPRLMKLLRLLAVHKGEVVTRQQIITEIWDNYGNADEGLSQAISFLRKIFADTDKKMIRTISKKGYILDAIVSTDVAAPPVISPDVSKKTGKLHFIIPAVIVLAAIGYFLIPRITPSVSTEPPGTDIDTTYQYQEMKEANAEKNKAIDTGTGSHRLSP